MARITHATLGRRTGARGRTDSARRGAATGGGSGPDPSAGTRSVCCRVAGRVLCVALSCERGLSLRTGLGGSLRGITMRSASRDGTTTGWNDPVASGTGGGGAGGGGTAVSTVIDFRGAVAGTGAAASAVIVARGTGRVGSLCGELCGTGVRGALPNGSAGRVMRGSGVDPSADIRGVGVSWLILESDSARVGTVGVGIAAPGIGLGVLAGGVSVSSVDEMATVKAAITATLRERHGLAATADDDFAILDQSQLLETANSIAGTLALLLGGIASISLIVGGIGIMNILLVSVRERTHEIGIRKAVGARSRDILAQFLIEALTLSVLGGLIGIVLGLAVSAGIARLAGWSFVLSPTVVAVALLFSLAVGVIFGVWPARQAARLDPISALRWE